MPSVTHPSPSTVRRAAASRDAILISVAVLVLGAAGLFLWRSSGEQQAPTDASSNSYLRCEACKHEFALNAREMQQVMQRREYATASDGRTFAFKCPKCGEMKAVVAGGEPAP